ncbi:MAG: 16S rRNA (uracil(1498)-N(3))-methyltransferase [Candidatus Aminicenantales bacterium]
MTSNRFLVKQENLHLPYARLDGEEHHHLSRVLRVRAGEQVWLMDEKGSSFRAKITEVGRHETRLLVLEREERAAAKIRLVLGQALIKSRNMDLIIQKATELGVQAVVPVEASRSVPGLKERSEGKIERWRKIARESAKQSRRTDLPSIHPPQSLSVFLESREESNKYILCEDGGVLFRQILAEAAAGPAFPGMPEVVLLVGPEGGWSREEEQRAREHGFIAISLGARILRSETAALAALAAIQVFWGG